MTWFTFGDWGKSVLSPSMSALCTSQDSSFRFVRCPSLLKFSIDAIRVAFRTDIGLVCQHTSLLVRIIDYTTVTHLSFATGSRFSEVNFGPIIHDNFVFCRARISTVVIRTLDVPLRVRER